MPRYVGSPDFRHDGAECIGVLLVNSGTPDSPSVRDVRRFLRALLSDPRVVEVPRFLWLPLLNGAILLTRPFRSARKYRRIWSQRGSPLLHYTDALRARLADELSRRVLAPITVEAGMLYAAPSVADALDRLIDDGARRILVLPLFPQYCGATTGAVYDQVGAWLARQRWVPEVRYVNEYHDHPAYIDALRVRIAEHWAAHGRTQHLLLSFHGIPEQYFRKGDPYFCKCQKTARLLADELGLTESEWSLSFQSKVGPGRWLRPYTEHLIAGMPGRGITRLTVACPGFAVDCLETLEEIDLEDRDRFHRAGGERFDYVPALNDHPRHALALADLVTQHAAGWAGASLAGFGAAHTQTA
jgi:ferrochelatase